MRCLLRWMLRAIVPPGECCCPRRSSGCRYRCHCCHRTRARRTPCCCFGGDFSYGVKGAIALALIIVGGQQDVQDGRSVGTRNELVEIPLVGIQGGHVRCLQDVGGVLIGDFRAFRESFFSSTMVTSMVVAVIWMLVVIALVVHRAAPAATVVEVVVDDIGPAGTDPGCTPGQPRRRG